MEMLRPMLCQKDNWSTQSDDPEPRAVRWATRIQARTLSPAWTHWHYTEGNGFFTACGSAVIPFVLDGSPEERPVGSVTCKLCFGKMNFIERPSDMHDAKVMQMQDVLSRK